MFVDSKSKTATPLDNHSSGSTYCTAVRTIQAGLPFGSARVQKLYFAQNFIRTIKGNNPWLYLSPLGRSFTLR